MPSGGATVGRSQYTAAEYQVSSTDTVLTVPSSPQGELRAVGTRVSASIGKYSTVCSDTLGALHKLNGVLDCCNFCIIYHELFKHLFQSSSLFPGPFGSAFATDFCDRVRSQNGGQSVTLKCYDFRVTLLELSGSPGGAIWLTPGT